MKLCKPTACMCFQAVVTAALCCSVGFAQDAGSALQTVRTRSDFTAADLASIDRYVDDQIDKLAADIDDLKVVFQFRADVLAPYNFGDSTTRFKRTYAEHLANRVSQRVASGPADVGRELASTLIAIADPSTLEALRATANARDDAIRVLAVEGVRLLAEHIQSDPTLASSVVSWLEGVGKRESNSLVLKQIYLTFAFDIKQDEQVQAILAILELRLKAFENGTLVDETAELEAFHRLKMHLSSAADADKTRLVQSLAKFLVRYTHRFVYADLATGSRENLHRLVYMVEALLQDIGGVVADGGGITAAIGGSPASDRTEAIRQALQWWVGSAEGAGQLNDKWQVPINGGVDDLDFNATPPSFADSTPGTP